MAVWFVKPSLRVPALSIVLSVAVAPYALAQNNYTDAGTEVSNNFTLDYTVNSQAQAQIVGAADAFIVDRLVDLLVSYQSNDDDDDVQPGAVATALLFKLENDGNDNFAYTLAATNQTGETPEEFDFDGAITIQYSINTDGDNVYEPGADDGALTTYSAPTPDLAKDESMWVLVSGNVPAGAVDTAVADIVLTATAVQPTTWAEEGSVSVTPGDPLVADSDGNDTTPSSAAENVFADGAGSGGDNANDAKHSDIGTLTISTANLIATKSVTVFSTNLDGSFSCGDFAEGQVSSDEYSTPGACLEYQIDVQNDGSASATSIAIADELPQGLIFVAAQASNFTTSGSLTEPAADTICNGTDNCTLSYSGATLNNGATGTLKIRVLVN